MSNYLAIATTTEVLKEMVQGAIQPIPGATVTTTRPYAKPDKTTAVNLYLYQTLPNPSFRNIDLTTRGRNGKILKAPQAALDLSYLFSFYGDETKQEPQRLLGAVTADLHAKPFLEKKQIREVIGKVDFLQEADLEESEEEMKISLSPSSLKESYQLWSAFQAPYVLSVTYDVRVILLESDLKASAPALPVRP